MKNHFRSNLEIAENPEAEKYWMEMADFYDWPHILYFHSYQHLKQILLTADLQTISQQMKEELKLRKVEVTKSWCDIAQRVSDNIK